MTKMSTMPRLALAAVATLIGIIALTASTFAQPANPHRFFGGGLEPGDTVGLQELHGDHYDEVATATADANGDWYIDAAAEGVDENSFTLNGKSATATLTSISDSTTQVDLEAMAMPGMDEGMGEGMGEEGMDEGMGEGMDEGMEETDEQLDEDVGMPSTGSGGLADSSGISAGLIGLLIALGAAAIAGLGLRRVRNRA